MSELKDCVLVVDDEFLIVEGLCMQLETMGLKVCATAVSADQAIREAQTHRPRLVLMDMRLLGEKDGVDAALAIHETVGSKMIFITGSNEPSTMARIQEDHPTAVLIKPIADRQLRVAVEQAMA